MMTMPNQLHNAENENITIGVLYPFCTNNEFVKNTNSVSVGARSFLFCRVGLATNGVCVFGALTSVSALFYFMWKEGNNMWFWIVGAGILLAYFTATWFFEVAKEKGYHDKKYFWICFWLGYIGIPLIIALPDRGKRAQSVVDDLPEL